MTPPAPNLIHMESVFNKPIAQLTQETGISKVAWVRFCKNIGFDGLRDLKKTREHPFPPDHRQHLSL